MRSHLRGLQASTLKLTLWRREREAALEAGHRPPELCFPGEVGGHFQVPGGVIFEQPEVIEMERQNRLGKVRDELKDIADSAKYSGDESEL